MQVLKKRIIFTLLYNDGYYMLSRNFRLQKVGDIGWLQKNYNFNNIAFSIDELIVLDVSRKERDIDRFCQDLKCIAKDCFIPVSAGGGIDRIEKARKLFQAGADKVTINSLISKDTDVIREIASIFGQQSIIVSVDYKKVSESFDVYTENGCKLEEKQLPELINYIAGLPVGELYLNSIDRDGTGQGLLMSALDCLPDRFPLPVIMAGGVGNYNHLAEGLSDRRVSAVATAHLFNFVGDGLEQARNELLVKGFDLVKWDRKVTAQLINAMET